MKTAFFFGFFLLCVFISYGQDLNIENFALQNIIENKVDYEINVKEIFVYKRIRIDPGIKYFSERQFWHIKGILQTNCYSKNDSLMNSIYKNKCFRTEIKSTSVKRVNSKKMDTAFGVKIIVFKRFYYCNKIYVLVNINDDYNLVVRNVLFEYKSDGSYLSKFVETFIG